MKEGMLRFLCRLMGHFWVDTWIAMKDNGTLLRCKRCGKTKWEKLGTA